MNPRFATVAVLSLALARLAPAGELPPPESSASAATRSGSAPRIRMGIGIQWRSLDSVSLRVSPQADLQQFGLPVPSPRHQRPSNGTAGIPGSHLYDDGFVYPDGGTVIDGTTWWWGYERADQVRGNSLVFAASGTFSESAVSSMSQSLDRESDENGFGPVFEAAADWHLSNDWTIGAEFTFSWFGFETNQQGPLASLTQSSMTFRTTDIDTYDLGGVIVPLPPYSGTLEGPGPVIDASPTRTSRSELIQQSRAQLVSAAEASLSADIWNVSLGPSVAWTAGQFSLRASLALELDLISWEQTTTETASVLTGSASRTLREWVDSDSGTSVVPGIGLGASARWQITPHFDVTAFAKWRSMDSLEIENGRTSTTIDSSGFVTGVSVGYSF